MPPIDSLPGLPEDYTPKFFAQDVVSKIMDPSYRGIIVRCWSTDEAPPPAYDQNPLDRPLKRGEVGIMENAYVHMPKREIVSEASLVLVHRDFFPGDIVKRSLTASSSAVVLNIESEVQLYSAYDKDKKIKGWVAFDKLKNTSVEPGDKVVYDQWIGTVQDVFEAGQFAAVGKEPYFLTAPSGFFGIGASIEKLIERHQTHIPPLPPSGSMSDICISYHALIVAVNWNAINQSLPIVEQSTHPEPAALWSGEDLAKLTWWPATARSLPGPRQPMRFKDPKESPMEDTKADPTAMFPSDDPIYKVDAIRNKATVRWQDGSETTDFSSAFVPYPNIDDYETWPGDHLIWHGDEGERKAVVIQSFDARQRVADLLFSDSGERSVVSVLELETSGPEHAEYGVRIGEIVLITPDNGEAPPSIPPLGRFQVDPSLLNQLDDRSNDLAPDFEGRSQVNLPPAPAGDRESVDWWGEVSALQLDGTISVRLANGTTTNVGLQQLVRLQDGEAMMDDQMEEIMDAEDQFDEMLEAEGIAPGEEIPPEMRERVMEQMMLKVMGGELSARGLGAQFHLWKSFKPELDDPAAALLAGPVPRRLQKKEKDEEDEEWETLDGSHDGDEIMEDEGVHAPEDASMKDMDEVDQKMDMDVDGARDVEPTLASTAAGPSSTAKAQHSALDDLEDDEAWQRFMILESAPQDHHFIAEKTGAANKAYQNRLQKERKTLMNALPENILVRTYEDRTDLMRVLIIGPESTPYANAPFIFDIYLKPTAFPQEPPLVHFHSHTNGLGRCNPNLYEEGKVCLSVLGTWAGEQSETWNPSKSSLLQVFVSISGLVLVRSPYFCEPGVAKLEGTREGRLNSRLYSEKAYILSRNFVRQALLYAPTGFEEEIKHFYLARGRLRQVLDHAKNLISASEAAAAKEETEEVERSWNEDAVGDLTMGAVITLKKTVAALERIAVKERVV